MKEELEKFLKAEIEIKNENIKHCKEVIKSSNNPVQIRTYIDTQLECESMISAYNKVSEKLKSIF